MLNLRNRPTARVIDGKLVLNMPDAETPALWVMDLSDAQTSVLRLENDRGGLFILKKHSGKGAETVAVYRNRESGTRAMEIAAKALEKTRNGNGGEVYAGRGARIGRGFTYFVMGWFVVWTLGLTPYVVRFVLSPFLPPARPAITATNLDPTMNFSATGPRARAPEETDATEAGVPVSADDFLKERTQ